MADKAERQNNGRTREWWGQQMQNGKNGECRTPPQNKIPQRSTAQHPPNTASATCPAFAANRRSMMLLDFINTFYTTHQRREGRRREGQQEVAGAIHLPQHETLLPVQRRFLCQQLRAHSAEGDRHVSKINAQPRKPPATHRQREKKRQGAAGGREIACPAAEDSLRPGRSSPARAVQKCARAHLRGAGEHAAG